MEPAARANGAGTGAPTDPLPTRTAGRRWHADQGEHADRGRPACADGGRVGRRPGRPDPADSPPVGAPPRVTEHELERALARITARHAHHDPRWAEMGTDPRSVLEHLSAHSAGLPRHVQADDLADALVLDAALWWSERERRRSLLRRARSLGMSLSEIGARLNLASKSAVRDHLDRLDAQIDLTASAGFARTAASGRGPRRRARPDGIETWNGQVPAAHHSARDRRRLAAAAPDDQAWLEVHGPSVLAVISRLVAQIERALPQAAYGKDPEVTDTEPAGGHPPPSRYGAAEATACYPINDPDPDHDLGEWIDELRDELDTAAPSPATMATLALALGEPRHARLRCPGDDELHTPAHDPTVGGCRHGDESR